MVDPRTFRQLLVADLALVLDIAPARDVALALQRFWERKGEGEARLAEELARIAGLTDEQVAHLESEADRCVEEAGGDPRRAVGLRGGVDHTLHLELSRVDVPLLRAIGEAGAVPRAQLRTTPVTRYIDFASIGQGGMGAVYLALDTELNRRV
ncbi:MAG: hypothetical protein ACYS99_10000, partial [Planctomycetota bacterium]